MHAPCRRPMGHAPPAGGPSTSVRTQDHACSLVCPTLRGPLPLLGNGLGLGLGHGHGHEHGWLAGWLGSYPAAVSRAPTTPRRSGAKKKVQCINPFLPVVLSRKGNPPPPPLSPQQGGGGICCSRAPVCACHHTSQYLHAARCGMCVRFGEFMYVRRAGTRMDGAASSRMTKGDPNSCSRTPRNTGRWPEQEAPTWYFRQLSEKRQGCILRLYSMCRGAVFLLAFPWPALARLETPS